MADNRTRRATCLTAEAKQRIKESAKREMAPKNSFYTKPGRTSTVSRFDRASTLRAAGIYVQNA